MVASFNRAKGKRKAVEEDEDTPLGEDDEDAVLRDSLETFNGKKPPKRPMTEKPTGEFAPAPKKTGRPKGSKTKKTKAPAQPKSKGKGKGKGKGRVAKAKAPTKKELAQARKASNLFNKDSLIDHNIFRDVETNTGLDTLPGLNPNKRKEAAMKELLASLPVEIQNNAKTDKDQILLATRSFGPNRCHATPDGQWQINGMKSKLTHYQMLGTSFMRDREMQEEDEPRGGELM